MKRIKIGDVFEIKTSKGRAYFQYVYQHETLGELIRVLPGLSENTPDNLNEIVASPERYLLHFPLKAAVKLKITEFVSNFNLPETFQLPSKFRTEHFDNNGEFISWHIVDYKTWNRETVKVLNEKQKKLSPWDHWNDTLLIERLEEDWSLDNW